MPWVAWLALVGTLAIAGIPPLNGFVSEWLLLQAFLFAGDVPRTFVNMLLPVGAAVIALCTALAGYVMVKFFGVIFLGQPREAALAQARDAGLVERLGLVWLALACVGLGLFPVQVIDTLDVVARELLKLPPGGWGGDWWLLAPAAARHASYGPLALFGVTRPEYVDGCDLLDPAMCGKRASLADAYFPLGVPAGVRKTLERREGGA
jgi:formate hydrogenlyase subunit 3/multisubunit Na+/H+ antiporter MnhD subunit